MTMSRTLSDIDDELRAVSAQYARAEERLDYEALPVLSHDLDDLLDKRRDATLAEDAAAL